MTVADLKKAEQDPRLLPIFWEELLMMFTTYALFLEMLFTKRN